VIAEIFDRIKDTVGIDVVSILTQSGKQPRREPIPPAMSPPKRPLTPPSTAREGEVR
jgi:hypothetical protein